MAVTKLSENQVKTYLEMLLEHGEDGLYRRTIGMGIMRYASNIKQPEIELLDLSEAFFIAHRRRSEEEVLFTIGKILRKAAHALYRKLQKDNKKEINNRFLNVVK